MSNRQLRILTGEATATVSISMLADNFIERNKEEELSPATISTRRTHLKQFVAFCREVNVDDITLINNHFIDKYFVQYRETHGKSTTNTGKRIIKVFLTWVRDYKEVDIRAIPESIRSVKVRDKTPKAIDHSIIAEVIHACPDEQDRLIIALFAETGIRISELISLKVSDIRGDELDIYGKGSIDRTAFVTETLAKHLSEFIESEGRKPDDHVFKNTRNGYQHYPLRKETVRQHVKQHFMDIAGIEMHPHQLRHSFAIHLLQSGCDTVTIMELLGHKDIKTTMEYLRVTNQQLKSQYRRRIGKSFLA